MMIVDEKKLNKMDIEIVKMKISGIDPDVILCSVAEEVEEETKDILHKKNISVDDIDDIIKFTQHAQQRWGINAGDLMLKLHQNYMLKRALGLYRD